MLNIITITGRLTKNPELRQTQSGNEVVLFAIACQRDYAPQGEERQTDFFDCMAWGKTAEFIDKYFVKGDLMTIAGRLETSQYQTKEGENRKSVKIVVNNAYFAQVKAQGEPKPERAEPAQTTPDIDVDNEDLPF